MMGGWGTGGCRVKRSDLSSDLDQRSDLRDIRENIGLKHLRSVLEERIDWIVRKTHFSAAPAAGSSLFSGILWLALETISYSQFPCAPEELRWYIQSATWLYNIFQWHNLLDVNFQKNIILPLLSTMVGFVSQENFVLKFWHLFASHARLILELIDVSIILKTNLWSIRDQL